MAVPAVNLAALDLLASLVAVVGVDGTIRFANAAFEDALGQSRRSIEGTRLSTWFAAPLAVEEALDKARSRQVDVQRFDVHLLRPHQAEGLPAHLVLSNLQQTVEYLLGIKRDFVENDAAEQGGDLVVELLPSEQQARQARDERLLERARGNKELIRNLAHEIKNPLGGIRGAAQLLDMEMADRGLTEYTQVIIREADRLQALVDRLLAPHRRPPEVEDVNVHEVCERVRSLVLAEFPQGLTVVRDYDTSIPEFRGDREALIQAVLNLAHNACQVMQPQMKSTADAHGDGAAHGGARLTLRTRIARQVTLGKERHRLALQLHVIDNGPGVPDAIQDQLFMPLVTGREGGTGLGLTLAQTIVQQHRGLIACDSRPGHTDFHLTIPLA